MKTKDVCAMIAAVLLLAGTLTAAFQFGYDRGERSEVRPLTQAERVRGQQRMIESIEMTEQRMKDELAALRTYKAKEQAKLDELEAPPAVEFLEARAH